MTKRISQANTVVVPATVKVAEGQAAAAKAVVVPGEVEAAAKAEVAEKDVTTTTVEPVAALVAPAPLAMVAAQDTTTTTDTTATTTSTQSTDDGTGTDYTPYIVGGVLLAGGILAVALSSDDGDPISSTPTPTPTPTPTNAVTFSSATTASIAENTPAGAAGNVVIDVNAAAASTGGAIVYTLGGTDAAAFNINASTGEVRFNASPNFEAKSSYSITVTGTSAANGTTPAATASQTITVTVTNVNEAPTFASATVTATAVAENAAPGVIYTAVATDPDGTAAPNTLTYTLGGTDAAAFTINAATGAVSLRASADFETKPSYSFTVTATDQGGLAATQTVTLGVTNVNEAPTFGTATTRAVSYAENGTAAVFTAGGATDPDGTAAPNTLTYSLTGADAALFSVNGTTGAVSFRASPDFETPRSAANSNVYSFNLVATDQGGLSATQANTITVTDVNEGPAAVTVSLDNATAAVSGLGTGGAAQATIFTDDLTVASNATINNFGRDDIIRFTGATSVSFSSVDTNLLIEFTTAGGVRSAITVNNVVSADNFNITNEARAEAAVNAFLGTTNVDYFRFG